MRRYSTILLSILHSSNMQHNMTLYDITQHIIPYMVRIIALLHDTFVYNITPDFTMRHTMQHTIRIYTGTRYSTSYYTTHDAIYFTIVLNTVLCYTPHHDAHPSRVFCTMPLSDKMQYRVRREMTVKPLLY